MLNTQANIKLRTWLTSVRVRYSLIHGQTLACVAQPAAVT